MAETRIWTRALALIFRVQRHMEEPQTRWLRQVLEDIKKREKSNKLEEKDCGRREMTGGFIC